MDLKNDLDKVDEIMLPGFRFHPTDEELVGFYLKRKIQQRPLSIELIKQLDIYKYDPWDLPKMATTGEKEWYFYCPRDRKYRNSARPNRVTGAGFWKATGTDRPIYSSEGTKCIGLKKSLVFYRGRAAKGIKTDWMMHEFRLPSLHNPAIARKPLDKSFIPANESWAICRIFKKTNTSAQRALSQSWASSLQETTDSVNCTNFISENTYNGLEHHGSAVSYPPLDFTTFKSKSSDFPTTFMFSPPETSTAIKPSVDVASMLLNLSPMMLHDLESSPSIDFEQQNQSNGFSVTFPLEANGSLGTEEEDMIVRKTMNSFINGGGSNTNNQWGSLRTMNFPFNLASNPCDEWKLSFPWESVIFPSEMSTGYSTNKCYT